MRTLRRSIVLLLVLAVMPFTLAAAERRGRCHREVSGHRGLRSWRVFGAGVNPS